MHDPNDVVDVNDPYMAAASRHAGVPVGRVPSAPSYPLYGMGTAPAMAPVAPSPAMSFVRSMRGPAIGFVLGALAVGGAWFYFGHWLPLKKKANIRSKK